MCKLANNKRLSVFLTLVMITTLFAGMTISASALSGSGTYTTMDNWETVTDNNLYLYLTGASHTVTVNGTSYELIWDEGTHSFSVEEA